MQFWNGGKIFAGADLSTAIQSSLKSSLTYLILLILTHESQNIEWKIFWPEKETPNYCQTSKYWIFRPDHDSGTTVITKMDDILERKKVQMASIPSPLVSKFSDFSYICGNFSGSEMTPPLQNFSSNSSILVITVVPLYQHILLLETPYLLVYWCW